MGMGNPMAELQGVSLYRVTQNDTLLRHPVTRVNSTHPALTPSHPSIVTLVLELDLPH